MPVIFRCERLPKHCVLLPRDIGSTRVSQVEHNGRILLLSRFSQISHNQTAHILGKGNSETSGPFSGTTLQFGLKGDL